MGGSDFDRVFSLSFCLSVCCSLEILSFTNLAVIGEGSGEEGWMLLRLEWGAGKERGLLICFGKNGAGIHRSLLCFEWVVLFVMEIVARGLDWC